MNRNISQLFIVSIVIALALPQKSWAVGCSAADIVLTTQEAISNFQATYGGGGTCDTITGSLSINDLYDDPQSDITDLSGLQSITEIGGNLGIEGNPILANVDGLNNVTKVGGNLTIGNNTQLTNINGLAGLKSTGYELRILLNPLLTNIDVFANLTGTKKASITHNSSLTNIDGLSFLTNGDELQIVGNDALTNIDGLSSIVSVGILSISFNDILTNIDGLFSLAEVGHTLEIQKNAALTNIDGLSSLNKVGISLIIRDNAALTNIDGLSSLTRVDFYLNILSNTALSNVDGLSSLANVGMVLEIAGNTVLTNIDGLSSLTNVGEIIIFSNQALTNVDGLSSVDSVDGHLGIERNPALTNLDGLSSFTSVGDEFFIRMNESLANCEGVSRLLDQWDDAKPGPGPGEGGVPDVSGVVLLGDNLEGCNSIQEIFADTKTSRINSGLNDAWYNPLTDGQGFFIGVFPELGAVSLAWFTYDTELPPDDAQANLGDPGHRWLTAIGPIEGNEVWMDIEMTSGGLFDTPTEIQRTDPPGSDGTIILTFTSCNSGTVEYDIPSINRQGTVPIQRVAGDNIALCELLSNN